MLVLPVNNTHQNKSQSDSQAHLLEDFLLMATEAKVSSWQRVSARNREKWSGPTHNIRHRVDALGFFSRGNDPSILALGRENDIRHRAEEVFENLAKKQG